MKLALAAVVSLGALAACKAAASEPSGIGSWDVTKTHRKDATGHCDRTDLPDGRKGTWCYMQPPVTVGEQPAQVDLYFAGTDDLAPLIELQLKVPACDIDKVDAWARTSFGTAMSRGGGRTVWKNRYMYVVLIPDGSRCLVRVLPLSEEKELQRITAAPAPAPAPAAP